MSNRAYYSAEILDFTHTPTETILGKLTSNHSQDLVHLQTNAWKAQIEILKRDLINFTSGFICFEMLIPRMGKRADAILILNGIIFVLEFKVGEKKYLELDLKQAEGYALDLSCFHETSHDKLIIPILVCTNAESSEVSISAEDKGVIKPLKTNDSDLSKLIDKCLKIFPTQPDINANIWLAGQYKPTPTIIEAAQALYTDHDVEDIARHDAGAVNLAKTASRLDAIIHDAHTKNNKVICFVTGVPGAGKTLVGLDIATKHNNPEDAEHAVFLSGNGPLVEVLREALARDSALNNKAKKIGEARRETSSFIQNIHHFRDDALADKERPPIEKVVIFDEAQRAWNEKKASQFMSQKRDQAGFNQSEPEFLISIMDRHKDWCVIIALIGGGQEINDGEAGLNGWFSALSKSFSDWKIYYSEKLNQIEYAGNDADIGLLSFTQSQSEPDLHLSTSMRAFRAEKLSHFVHYLIHNQPQKANETYKLIANKYPIFITRDLQRAKKWLKSRARGLESIGMLASSGAKRLKAEGINVSNDIQASEWFLNPYHDVRSCHFLEDAGTEFLVQGLELDWCLVAWDADYRYLENRFEHWSFKGTKWQNLKDEFQKRYLENSYRVLLTRARQGMVIYVPTGNSNDITRLPDHYQSTYNYLKSCGITELVKI